MLRQERVLPMHRQEVLRLDVAQQLLQLLLVRVAWDGWMDELNCVQW